MAKFAVAMTLLGLLIGLFAGATASTKHWDSTYKILCFVIGSSLGALTGGAIGLAGVGFMFLFS